MENNEQIPSGPVTPEILTQSLISIAIESWRIGKVSIRMMQKLDAGEQSRFQGQFRWFFKKVTQSLEDAGMNIVNLEGHPFDPGMAATPLNIEDFDSNDKLIVDQMLEPVIMGREGVIKTGTVTLRKVK